MKAPKIGMSDVKEENSADGLYICTFIIPEKSMSKPPT